MKGQARVINTLDCGCAILSTGRRVLCPSCEAGGVSAYGRPPNQRERASYQLGVCDGLKIALELTDYVQMELAALPGTTIGQRLGLSAAAHKVANAIEARLRQAHADAERDGTKL